MAMVRKYLGLFNDFSISCGVLLAICHIFFSIWWLLVLRCNVLSDRWNIFMVWQVQIKPNNVEQIGEQDNSITNTSTCEGIEPLKLAFLTQVTQKNKPI